MLTTVWSRAAIALALLCPAAAAAQDSEAPLTRPDIAAESTPRQGAAQGEAAPSVLDQIWRLTQWYRNDDNPVIQRLRFVGRYQQDYAALNADQGTLSEWNVRRLRLGLQANVFQTITLHTEVDLDPQEADPLYVRLTDAYVEWTHEQVALTVGKHAMGFTADGMTSSRELLAMDRGNLTNNIWFTEEYLPGVSVSGDAARWAYHVGVYSGGAENREFGDFRGSLATLGSLGYDFARSASTRTALMNVNYVHQDPDEDNTFTKPYRHILSMNYRFENQRWGLRWDVSAASGVFEQSDVWGVMAMPFVNVTPKLQLVGRYTFVESAEANGIELGKYEDEVVPDRGDRYSEFYVGANYYFHGHRLKLQTGVQAGDMNDRAADGGAYSGVSWVAGLRVGW